LLPIGPTPPHHPPTPASLASARFSYAMKLRRRPGSGQSIAAS
jgi:hypothetical protein